MTQRDTLSLDEILSGFGNRPIYDEMVAVLRGNKAIAFVGAGASAGMYPLWGELIKLLADHAVAQGEAEPEDAARWKANKTFTPQQLVNIIVDKIGERHYRNFLKETFGPRVGRDGRLYTATHAALLRLPFRGYVTTNYDPALAFARVAIRPDCINMSTPTWQDDDVVHSWLIKDDAVHSWLFKDEGEREDPEQPDWLAKKRFVREDDCPILWLHGFWERPQGIVLNSGEYAEAYSHKLYRRLFDALWGQRRLVFVGFGFQDPQFTFMVKEYLRELENVTALAQHIALIGLTTDEAGSPPSAGTVREWRRHFETQFYVRPLFYPVYEGDHSALQTLLDGVVAECGSATPSPTARVPTALKARPSNDLPVKWVHEPSNDEKFVGREDEMIKLDRLVRDDAVRVIGLAAVGGTGKTALVGHWLTKSSGWCSRPFEGLFAWSFYQDRDPKHFFIELLKWAHKTLNTPNLEDETKPVAPALAASRKHSLLIVMDGLEILQEGPEGARHGAFLDPGLRQFLADFCRRQHRSLAVLTSRFAFADLTNFSGTAFHQLDLHGLTPERGAGLLDDLDVGGLDSERERISVNLDGHPLGLRVFASALPDEYRQHPQHFLNYAFRLGEPVEGGPLNDKLRRLLVFYEKKLPRVQSRLLSIVALFRTPVADETIFPLMRALFEEPKDQPKLSDGELGDELKRLRAAGILTHEPIEGGYGNACHPVLRNHFRGVLLDTDAHTARRAAGLLTGLPLDAKVQNTTEIEPLVLAIELLLDAGEFKTADELYRERLGNGRVFSSIPAPAEGLACVHGFVRDKERERQCQLNLGKLRLAFYLNEAGRYAMDIGQFEPALNYYKNSHDIVRGMAQAPLKSLSVVLQNESELLVVLGQLAEARRYAAEAIDLTAREADEKEIRDCHGYRGWAATLSGHVQAAAYDFAIGNVMESISELGRLSSDEKFYGIRGFQWAELLIRSGHSASAGLYTQADLRASRPNSLNADIARCHLILGWCALREGRFDDAEAELSRAESILEPSQLLYWLARLHIIAGELALARADADTAYYRAGEAREIASSREMMLVHADALVLRGRARMLKDQPDNALDDAEACLRLALECGYAWAERDALHLAADAHAALAELHEGSGSVAYAAREHKESRRARAEAQALAVKLVLTDEDLTATKKKALTWLRKAPWMRRSLPERG